MANQQPKRTAPEVCPVCGEDVPRKALACPECGADHESGWREGAETYDGMDLSDEAEFDYDEFVQQEFGASPKPEGMKTLWWITSIVLILLTVAGMFFVLW
jgi:hypothetical protein